MSQDLLPRSSRPELRALTGARFVAAAAVVLSHFVPLAGGSTRFAPIGGAAVAFFFVLSGFVLTYNYAGRLGELNAANYRRFLQARLARVFPVHVFVLLVFTAMVLPWLLKEGQHTATAYQTAKLVVGWVANLSLTQCYFVDVFVQNGWNAPAWSVSCELGFYAAFPALLWLLTKVRTRRGIVLTAVGVWLATVLAVAAVDVVIRRVMHFHMQTVGMVVYRAPYVRIGDFAVGCLAGLWFLRSGPRPWSHRGTKELAVAAAVVSLVLLAVFDRSVREPFNVAVVFVPPAVLLVVALSSGQTLAARCLAWAPLVTLGEASYSMYLVHFVPLRLLEHFTGTPSVLQATLGMAVCVPVSLLMFRYIEDPCRKLLRTGRPALAPLSTATPSGVALAA